MAVFSVVGLTAAMLTVVCWFPWLDRGSMPHSRVAQRIGQTLMAWPRWRHALPGSVAVCVAMALLLWLLGGLRAQDDVRQLQNASTPLVAQRRQVVLATFRNPQGLKSLGGNAWISTMQAGDPITGTPGSGTLGAVQSGALEESNVDLTGELVNLMTSQRLYQANAQTIKTQDSVLQTLVSMR